MHVFKLLIDGRLVEGAMSMEVLDPATGEAFAVAPRADAAQVDDAVRAAKTAFPAWAALGIGARRASLTAIADELEMRTDEFARLLTAEQGKPLHEAAWEIGGSVAMLRGIASLDLPVQVLKEDATQRILQHRSPLGVVAAITPWNFPVFLATVKVTSALLAGNTVVLKPAPTTPLTSLLLGELCNGHLPRGVLNVVTDRNDLGAMLTGHPDIAKVSFTGSTPTGRKVMQGAAGTLKRLTLELGGNDAAIVLDDVDPKEVASKLFGGAMANAGQVCLAIKRVYVHESIHDEVCDELAELARNAVLDDGAKQGSQLGPVQNKAQFDKLWTLIDEARSEGSIIAGGTRLARPGYFVPPTIVRDIPDGSRLVREEQFGPVLPVMRFGDIDDAVRRANDTDYGLGATVWGKDLDRALRVAMRLDAGTVWINRSLDLQPDVPVRGAKSSGIGAELGLDGLEEFTQAHVVSLAK